MRSSTAWSFGRSASVLECRIISAEATGTTISVPTSRSRVTIAFLWMIRSAIGSNFWSRHAPDNLELRAGADEIQSRSRTGKLRTARSAAQCIRPHLRNTKARTNP